MTVRTGVPYLLLCAALLMNGCSGALLHREGLDAAVRIAVVSVVMPRVADTSREGNGAVLQAAVDHAYGQVRSGLEGVRGWSVLDTAKGRGGKTALSFGKVSDSDLAGLFPQAEERGRVRELVSAELSGWKEEFIGAAGLPVVPREALTTDEERTQKYPGIRTVFLLQAGALCSALQVDAVVFAHLRLAITHPRENAFIVTDGRTDGMLAISATLMIVDRTGTIIADLGVRPIDDRSRKRDLLPVYRGAGKDAVKNENIDLADPKKKVARAFTSLADETVADLMEAFKIALGT